jgi:hypothetical protein
MQNFIKSILMTLLFSFKIIETYDVSAFYQRIQKGSIISDSFIAQAILSKKTTTQSGCSSLCTKDSSCALMVYKKNSQACHLFNTLPDSYDSGDINNDFMMKKAGLYYFIILKVFEFK